MNVQDARRATLDAWLKMARLPIDTASRLLPNGDRGPRTTAMLFVDRVDASIRDTLGAVLRDDDLREDASRRRAAADERQRALELRLEAQRKSEEADNRLARQAEAVEERQVKAERDAEERKQKTERERKERERQAEEAAAQREKAVDKVAQAKLSAAEEKSKKQRLEVLETKTDALDTESDALTARGEAQRLRKAATSAKAARKRSS